MQPLIAIVGIGACLPDAPTPQDFWENILRRHAAQRTPPPARWSAPMEAVYAPDTPQADRVLGRTGCFVTTPPTLEPRLLALPSLVLDALDESLRIALSAATMALQDAGLSTIPRERTDVILGHIALPTERNAAVTQSLRLGSLAESVARATTQDPSQSARLATIWRTVCQPSDAARWGAMDKQGLLSDPAVMARGIAALPAALIAQAFSLGGSTYTLDAACASSLYAIKLACDALQAGRSDAAVVGGLSRPDHLYTQMGFSQLRALSSKGFCTPFDARADGLLVGEGAAVFVLRRLADALQDRQTIYGVLGGVGLSNDIGGRLLAPDSEGQLRAMRSAYRTAGWEPQSVDLIECHATGTPVGDAVEFESLRSLWKGSQRATPCILGSAKSNIGHLLTAAGGAGLLKVLLALKTQMLPPTAHFQHPSNKIDLQHSPFRVLTAAQPWDAPLHHPRRAAVSAFGFGGINAHLLVEAFDPAIHTTDATRHKQGQRSVKDAHDTPLQQSDLSSIPVAVDTPLQQSDLSSIPVAVVGIAAQVGGYKDQEALMRAFLGEATELPRTEIPWEGIAETAIWGAWQGRSLCSPKVCFIR